MKQRIKEQVNHVVNNEIINNESRKNFINVLNRLRDEKYVSKQDILNYMTSFVSFMDDKLNKYIELALKTTINYEAIKEINGQYTKYYEIVEQESKEINEMMDNQGYTKAVKIENNSEYLQMLIRHEKEINELT